MEGYDVNNDSSNNSGNNPGDYEQQNSANTAGHMAVGNTGLGENIPEAMRDITTEVVDTTAAVENVQMPVQNTAYIPMGSSTIGADSLKASSFYTESHKKPVGKKPIGAFQLVILALISSIFGGAFVWLFLMFVTPAVQPAVDGYFDKIIPGRSTTTQGNDAEIEKKIEIEKSDSPVTAIAEKVGPSIVGIRATYKTAGFFFEEQQNKGEGSGIIIKSDGYIVTNFHVISETINPNSKKILEGAKIEVVLPSKKDKPYSAQVVGYDARTDLAVIKIDEKNLPAVELGNSDELKVGELAVAIGNPAGLEYMGSVTVGIISGLNRTVQSEVGKEEFKLIQTDAAINPGNSGGALVNAKGQLIGINSVKIVSEGFEGLGFAIPINAAKGIFDSLMEFTYVKGRPVLGVTPESNFNEEMAKMYDVPVGVLVAAVSPFSGAYKAGIQRGDIITKFEGKAVKNRTELDELRNKHKVGDIVSIEIYREKKTMTVKVTLTEDKG